MQPDRTHPQRVRLKALGVRTVRRRQGRNEAQVATNVQARASQPRSTELRASAVSVSGSLHLSAAEGSKSAAHLALLSGHARAMDDQVTLRRHWQRPGAMVGSKRAQVRDAVEIHSWQTSSQPLQYYTVDTGRD